MKRIVFWPWLTVSFKNEGLVGGQKMSESHWLLDASERKCQLDVLLKTEAFRDLRRDVDTLQCLSKVEGAVP